LVTLPTPMTKLEAIAYLRENKPEGVDQNALDAKEQYINMQLAKINGTYVPRKRGRPAKKIAATTPETSVVQKIVNVTRSGKTAASATQAIAAN
jgi:hypothetical protein